MSFIERIKKIASRKQAKMFASERSETLIDDRETAREWEAWKKRRIEYLKSIGDTETARKEGLI